MEKTVEYKVVIVNTNSDTYRIISNDIAESFELARKAYATELSLMTSKPERHYAIDIGDDLTFCLAINENRQVIGFVLLDFETKTRAVWTSHVYVRPEVRKMGVYRLMVERIKKFTHDLEYNRVFSLVHIENTTSQKSHIRVGFKKKWIGYEMEVE